MLCYSRRGAWSRDRYSDLRIPQFKHQTPAECLLGLDGGAINLIRLGKTDDALALLQKAEPFLTAVGDRLQVINHNGMVGMAHLQQGNFELARQAADSVASLLAHASPTICTEFDGYAGLAEVYLGLLEAEEKSQIPSEASKSQARQACRALSQFARVFPMAQPRAALLQGLVEWLDGKPQSAHTVWRKSLAAAEQMAMPYEAGRAHYEIGRHLPAGDPNRKLHLTRAREIFSELGAGYDLSLVSGFSPS